MSDMNHKNEAKKNLNPKQRNHQTTKIATKRERNHFKEELSVVQVATPKAPVAMCGASGLHRRAAVRDQGPGVVLQVVLDWRTMRQTLSCKG